MNSYEQYQKIKSEENSLSTRLFNSIKPTHIIIFIALLFIGNKLLENAKNNKTIMFIALGLVAIYIFSIIKQSGTKKAIPRRVAEQIALDDLKSEIGIRGSYPNGTQITPTGYFRDQSFDSGEGMNLFKYHIGFQIKEPEKGPVEIVYQMNPYTGEAKGIVEKSMGFGGEEIRDVQLVMPTVTAEVKKP